MTTASHRSESICALLPAFNEAENLPEVVDELAATLRRHFARWRILIVDDGSTDETNVVVAELQQRYEQLEAIHLRGGRVARGGIPKKQVA